MVIFEDDCGFSELLILVVIDFVVCINLEGVIIILGMFIVGNEFIMIIVDEDGVLGSIVY